jgi:hypothetical protein
MTWNYRVVRTNHLLDYPEKDGNRVVPEYKIHECYYDDEGKPLFVTEHGTFPGGRTLAELKSDLKNYVKALESPVLKYEDFDE